MARMRFGVHVLLEEEANRMLRDSLRGVTKRAEKSDVLTPWKEAERHRREVYTADGVPDAAVRRGMFHRVVNPEKSHLNSREGVAPPDRTTRTRQGISSSLGAFSGDFRDDD